MVTTTTNEVLVSAEIGDLETLKTHTNVKESLVDNNGACCLHYAARGGSVSVIEYLIKSLSFSAFNRSKSGASPLHDAATRGNTDVVRWLLENTEIKVNDQDGSGVTPIHLAARYLHFLTVEWFLDEAEADISIRSATGALPLHYAVIGGDINCVKILVDENPRIINMQMNNGSTPLYIACQEGLLNIAKYLVSRNAASKIQTYDAMSCLHAASQMGHLEVVRWLVKEDSCNPNERDFDGATPLHYAASRGHVGVVTWLMQHGGARVTLDNLGGSPLHSAAQLGLLSTVQALLDCGCDVTLEDNAALTAADLADLCEQTRAAALIRGEPLAPSSPGLDAEFKENNHREEVINTNARVAINDHIEDTDSNNNSSNFIDSLSPISSLQQPPKDFDLDITSDKFNAQLDEFVSNIQREASDSLSGLNSDTSGPTSVKPPIQRTPSRISVDSSASNFGVFEEQGAVIHTVTAEVHRTPSTVPPTPTITPSSSELLFSNSYKSSSTFLTNGYLASRPKSIPNGLLNVSSDQQLTSNTDYTSLVTQSHTTYRDSKSNGKNPPNIQPSEQDPENFQDKLNKLSPHASRLPVHNLRDLKSQTKKAFSSSLALFQQVEPVTKGKPSRADYRNLPDHIKKMPPPVSPKPRPSRMQNGTSNPPPPPPENTKSIIQINNSGDVTIINAKSGTESTKFNVGNDLASPNTQDCSENKSSMSVNCEPTNGSSTNGPLKNGVSSNRSSFTASLSDQLKNVSLSSSSDRQPPQPVTIQRQKNNLIADIQDAIGGNSSLSLRRAKTRGDGVSCVFQKPKKNGTAEAPIDSHKPLTGDWDPKNFLDKVEKEDVSGRGIPEWRRLVIAKHIAEKAQKDFEEKKVIDDYEARFKNMPAWKRALIERKEAEAKAEESG